MTTTIPAGWKPIESAPTLPEFSDGLHQYGPNILVFAAGKVTIARWWQTIDRSASNFIDRGSCAVHPTHWMELPAAPGAETGVHALPASVAPGDAQDEDDSIALDKLADYIADTWPDKKYGLEEICQRLHAMWPGEFIPLEDLSKNLPNVREALRALLTHWKRFQASDGNQQDAYNLMVKGARLAWKFAEDEINRVPVHAPAAGDARAITLPAKMPKHEGNGSEYPSSESYHEGYAEGWNDAIDAAIAAQQGKGG